MKKNDRNKMREKDVSELKSMVTEAKNALLSLRLDFSMGKVKNTKALFEKRKEIARMLTYLKEKELKI